MKMSWLIKASLLSVTLLAVLSYNACTNSALFSAGGNSPLQSVSAQGTATVGNGLTPTNLAKQFTVSVCGVISNCSSGNSQVSPDDCYSNMLSSTNFVTSLGASAQTYPTLGALIAANSGNSIVGNMTVAASAITQIHAESCNSSAVQSVFSSSGIDYTKAAALLPPSSSQVFVPLATWSNVTPASIDLTDPLSCGNYGSEGVQADPANPSNLYTQFNCQGIWKSTDFGASWIGPINTGVNGTTVSDCAGGIAVARGSSGTPTLYLECIRGAAIGFWRSLDGGVNWTNYSITPNGVDPAAQRYALPAVDPYDSNHLLMGGNQQGYTVESTDGGQTWSNVSLNSGMMDTGGSSFIFFINTGKASSTRGNWLWMSTASSGNFGTWRTTNNGSSWVQVDKNEANDSISQIYQPDNNGVVYMAGINSALGWGTLKSSDYGMTWVSVAHSASESIVFGTPKNIYTLFAFSLGTVGDLSFQVGAQPGTGAWATPGMPAAMNQSAGQVAVVNDGTHNIMVGGMWGAGIWRYVEP